MFLCPLSWETWIGWTLLFNKVESDVLRAEWFATFDRLLVLCKIWEASDKNLPREFFPYGRS